MVALPPFVLVERDALIAEIDEAFADVSREGGVSWSESVIMDLYGSDLDRDEARAQDLDTGWQELVDDPKWRPDMGVGGWSFLDPIAFRYYLPAGMVRSLREGWDVGIQCHLELPEGNLREWRLAKWSRLDLSQRLCVKRFLDYMGVVSGYLVGLNESDGWIAALNDYWRENATATPPESPRTA